MRVYLGTAADAVVRVEALRGAPILETFAYPLAPKWRGHFKEVYLDSGAFTAWKQGGGVDVEAYIDHALANDYVAVAADLSVTARPEDTLRHAERMGALGLPAVPAFHQGEPWDVLDYIAANYSYIGVGCTESSAQSSSVDRWLRSVFERVCKDGRPTVRVHGYRLVSYAGKYPFYSVDSTSWSNGNGVSIERIQRQLPWLTPLESAKVVLAYYDRLPRCSRMKDHAEQGFLLN